MNKAQRERKRGAETLHLTHCGCAQNLTEASVLLAFTQRLLCISANMYLTLCTEVTAACRVQTTDPHLITLFTELKSRGS